MVKLDFKYGLPFCEVTLIQRGKSITLDNVLLDTGSGGTVFKMDRVDQIDITIEAGDTVESISGVGGTEFVYKKVIDCIYFGDVELKDFTVEVGIMDYGFDMNGIIGIDFLKKIGAVIDLEKMMVSHSKCYS